MHVILLTMPNQRNDKSAKKRMKSVKNSEPILTINLRGDDYKVYLHTSHDLNRLVSHCEAYMKFEEKEIRFSEENLKITTILHELVHCFIASTYIHELTELGVDDFEEIVCEVVSRNYEEIGKLAKMVENELKNELKLRRQNANSKKD